MSNLGIFKQTDRVSRADLRAINVGESVTFFLPSQLACEYARQTAYQLKRYEDLHFERTSHGSKNTEVTFKRIK